MPCIHRYHVKVLVECTVHNQLHQRYIVLSIFVVWPDHAHEAQSFISSVHVNCSFPYPTSLFSSGCPLTRGLSALQLSLLLLRFNS
eukprot:m.24299 g.24299  ORF g.24299 m.24299 type:complete len:86 (+) comp8582_c1_seq1:950-1207(+)